VFALQMIPEGFFFCALGCVGLEQGLAEAFVEVGVLLEAIVEVGVDELQGWWGFVFVVPEGAAHDVVYPLWVDGKEVAIAGWKQVLLGFCG